MTEYKYIKSKITILALPSYSVWHKPKKSEDMAIAILILLVCGGLYILYRMLCGFVNLMSNSKKLKR